MALVEIRVPVPAERAEELADLLAEISEELFMVVEDRPTASAWLVAYVGSAGEAEQVWRGLRVRTDGRLDGLEPEMRQMPDADWKESYKAHFRAWKFGHLHWVPLWERATFVVPNGEEVLWLDPGMAFGTGNHETTRLCCERLVQYAEKEGNGGRVIDAGCGSGILALSAARLGFTAVAAFDLDPEAVRISRENAALNHLEGTVEFSCADLEGGLRGASADLLLANIQADVLMANAGVLSSAVAPGGLLVLSGILVRELGRVRDTFLAGGKFARVESREIGEWADLALLRS